MMIFTKRFQTQRRMRSWGSASSHRGTENTEMMKIRFSITKPGEQEDKKSSSQDTFIASLSQWAKEKKSKKWLPDMDLNHDKVIQSHLCYRYTIGQSEGLNRLNAF